MSISPKRASYTTNCFCDIEDVIIDEITPEEIVEVIEENGKGQFVLAYLSEETIDKSYADDDDEEYEEFAEAMLESIFSPYEYEAEKMDLYATEYEVLSGSQIEELGVDATDENGNAACVAYVGIGNRY